MDGEDQDLQMNSFPLCQCISFPFTVKEGEDLTSSCLSPGFQGEWEHAKIIYKIKGQKAGIVTGHLLIW